MKSIATAVSTINIPFHGAELYVVNHSGEPYTPMKPIVEGMGMTWQSQHRKLMERFKTCIIEMMIQLPGDTQRRLVICLALRKLAGWLQTISPNKVRPEIRDKVIKYQEECDDVLYDYWTKGKAENPRKKTSVDERTPLRDAVNMLVSKKHLMYPEAYAMIHQRFNVESIEELDASQIPQAIEYIHRVVLEGEFIGKQEELPSKKLNIPDITMEWWYSNNFPMRVGNLERYPGHKVWHDLTLTPPMMYGEDTKSPALFLIEILERMGFDMVAPRIEVETMRIMLGKGKRQIRVVGDGRVKYLLSL
ncbi:antirepressor protein Ant [Salmonella enterica]|nr:antirepressor protein Ant [Salmonella enterica]EBQ8908743.1 antirepressor protein Ant [Salmonella enterica subsp. enterica serovar Hadar]EBY7132657.1 antirepressor protein Ant [Salmonella enterica subsp. enterica serovar Albany]EDW4386178.1 antirepressor protein Ant [Salmonella enterica subsp. enterica serovar Chailey]EBX0918454.1 antirepressor protein Ant [Salmonella enterica subsp. enterica serovar Hadar]